MGSDHQLSAWEFFQILYKLEDDIHREIFQVDPFKWGFVQYKPIYIHAQLHTFSPLIKCAGLKRCGEDNWLLSTPFSDNQNCL